MHLGRLALPITFALTTACGSAPSAPAAAPVVVVPATPSTPSAAAQAPVANLLAAIPEDVIFVARLDGKALRAAPLYAAAMEALGTVGAREPLDQLSAQCGFSIPEAIDEALIAGRFSERNYLLLARVTVPVAAALACLGIITKGSSEPITIADRPGIRLSSARVATSVDAVLVAGSERVVEAAVRALEAKRRTPHPIAVGLAVTPPTALSFSLVQDDHPKVASMNGALATDAAQLQARLVVETRSVELSAELVELLNKDLRGPISQLEGLPADTGAELRSYQSRIQIAVNGTRVTAEITLPGGADAQARMVGTAAAVGVFGVRRYLQSAKTAEARSTIGSISRDVWAYMEREDISGKRMQRFPAAPATPAKVPRGVVEIPTEKTWSHATWRAIRFQEIGPMRFSYSIIPSKDGRSATVRAQGDLDGDGKLSTFELSMKLNANDEVVASTDIVVTDEFE